MIPRIGIVGHPARQEYVERLAGALDADIVSVDAHGLGVAGNHALVVRSLLRQAKVGDWIVVLEDDALPISEFTEVLEERLSVAPAKIVSLYLGTGYPQQFQKRMADAVAKDTSWILHTGLLHAVGYALHPEVQVPISLGLDRNAEAGPRRVWAPDDYITKLARERQWQVAYTNPSLVEHMDGPQVIGQRTHLGQPTFGRKRPRHAHRFGNRLSWDDSRVIL